MRNAAIAMLVLAIVVGGGTVWLVRDFLESRPATVVEVQGSALATTKVVVARDQLNFGDTLRPELLKEVVWPAGSLPEGSFVSIDVLLEGAERRVALRAIEANEPILKSKVSGFGGRATLSQVIGEGMRAVTIRVNDVIGVAGFVLPGDRVDILLTRQVGKERADNVTDVLIQNIRVLAVDQLANERADTPVVAKATTIEVTPEQAQKLSLAVTVGTLNLALRNILSSEEENFAVRTIGVSDLIVRNSAPQTPSKSYPTTSAVRIYRGMKSNTQKVYRERVRAAPSGPAVAPTIKPSAALPRADRALLATGVPRLATGIPRSLLPAGKSN